MLVSGYAICFAKEISKVTIVIAEASVESCQKPSSLTAVCLEGAALSTEIICMLLTTDSFDDAFPTAQITERRMASYLRFLTAY